MRIGIVSDTHGLLRKEVIEGLQGVDHIIRAGDIDKKEVLDELEKIAPVTAVRGNADKDWAVYLPEKALLEFEGNKIYVIHNKGKIDDFIETVGALIRNNFNFNKAAQELFIHKNTLVYRYNKYKELMDIDPVAKASDRSFLESFYTYLYRKRNKYNI